MKIYSVSTIREIEEDYFKKHENADFELMLRAATSAFNILQQRFPTKSKYTIFIGEGNNGGDGIVLASLLQEKGNIVRIFSAKAGYEATTEILRSACSMLKDKRLKIEGFREDLALSDDEIIVDAIFGIGFRGRLEGEYLSVVEFINKSKKFVCSLDIASAVQADTGIVEGIAVAANLTITFICHKLGLFIGEGKEHTGDIVLSDLAINIDSYSELLSLVEKEELRKLLPERKARSNKGSFGKLLIIAGNKNMPGALLLSSKAALRSGVGKLFVYTDKANHQFLLKELPEAIFVSDDNLEGILEQSDACLIGPGLGKDNWAKNIVGKIFQHKIAKVIDADALNILSENPQKLENAIITPHILEAARLLRSKKEDLARDPIASLDHLNEKYDCNIILKTEVNYVLARDQGKFLIPYGNDALAKAGTGDVLAGLTAGFLAQTKDSKKAMLIATLSHSLFAVFWQKQYSTRTMLASDIANMLPEFFYQVERVLPS